MSNTTDLVDRQIEAYRRRDLDAFLSHYEQIAEVLLLN